MVVSQVGVDLVEPMPTGKGRTKFAIVAVDYFTKWVEVEHLAKITKQMMKNFI